MAPAAGFSLLGQSVEIHAPDATAADPLVFTFRLDASQIPSWLAITTVTIMRNGTPVAACSGAPGTASPDPCVASRQVLTDGDFEITVLTSRASLWSFGAPAPVANAGGPYVVDEGSTVTLDGSGSSGVAPLAFSWTAASPLDDAQTATPVFHGIDDGIEPVSLAVADANGAGAGAQTDVTVVNVRPTVTITSPAAAATVDANAGVSLAATFTDPGVNDTHTCAIDWGDGTTTTPAVGTGTCGQAHTYTAPGAYTITVSVTDDDGGVGTKSVGIVVRGFAAMAFHYHWSGDAGFPVSTSYDATGPATVRKGVAYAYRLHMVVTNGNTAAVTEKVQGGLTSVKGVGYQIIGATCGKAAIKTGKTGNVVVWNASGDGNTASPGFTMAAGQTCSLEVQINNASFGATGLQSITGEWSETQTGPGSFGGKSPPVPKLNVNVVP